MANSPFDREVWNPRERPLTPDQNQEASLSDQALREVIDRLTTPRASATDPTMQTTPPTSFLGDGLRVVATAPLTMGVELRAGVGFFGDVLASDTDIDGIVGVNDVSRLKPLVLSNNESFVVPANATGSTRIDIIELVYRREYSGSTTRDIMPTIAPFTFIPTSVNKTFTWDLFGETGFVTSPANSTAYLSYKIGVAGAGVPAGTVGYEKLCEITVISGAVSIAQTDIVDTRALLAPSGQHRISIEITSTPATPVHAITSLQAPPGVEVEIADLGSSATQLDFFVTVRPGKQAASVVPQIGCSTGGATGVFSYIGAITIAASNFTVVGSGRALSPNPAVAGTLTYGTAALGSGLKTYLTIDYTQ